MTQLPGIIQSAPNQSLGFDADSVITKATAQQFASQGYKFCLRYLSLGAGEAPGDLTYEEALGILQGGLALMPVQHVSSPGWVPSAQLGTTYGDNAANNAISVGFPRKVNVWLDLEGISSEVSAEAVIQYCTSWYNAVAGAGYLPGLYVGANSILNSQQLYDLPFQHYWQSESTVPPVAVRSYQMVQSYVGEPVNGIGIDRDITYIDKEGGVPQWLILT
ncbi:DUF1906 domain-containing protein [Microcystis wesenbergii FACHB-1317]|uniref:DUF1906 domain-containing protein n=1 Tax=Microcystis TaxID=1125 RepID=UPI001680052B|nr:MULTISPECIES: DUF1906 domain-containing protein [Microcystis]MBD2288207.1 DUF1906 domain-containing protein [Microcystis wesenbergii FACHB-1317]UZO75359.1 DUF1906 domain-containing protein [Microcystis aeruginosa str. Chao 1910]